MKTQIASTVALLLTSAAMAERPACPTGEMGDWRWQVNATYIQLKSDAFPLRWDTVGDDAETTKMNVLISHKRNDEIRSIQFEFDPLNFKTVVERDGQDPRKTVLFAPRPRGPALGEDGFIRAQHDYVAVGFDVSGEKAQTLFQTRVEEWDTNDPRVGLSWAAFDHAVDWSFADQSALRFALNSTHFASYGQPNPWSMVAISDEVDLNVLKPILAQARAAQGAISETMCEMDYRF
ncbi:MAG: hypothetical protein AAGF20_04120 [Pseudomonadota bacterium]